MTRTLLDDLTHPRTARYLVGAVLILCGLLAVIGVLR